MAIKNKHKWITVMVYVRAKLHKNSNIRKLKVKIPDGLGVNYITPKVGRLATKKKPSLTTNRPPRDSAKCVSSWRSSGIRGKAVP